MSHRGRPTATCIHRWTSVFIGWHEISGCGRPQDFMTFGGRKMAPAEQRRNVNVQCCLVVAQRDISAGLRRAALLHITVYATAILSVRPSIFGSVHLSPSAPCCRRFFCSPKMLHPKSQTHPRIIALLVWPAQGYEDLSLIKRSQTVINVTDRPLINGPCTTCLRRTAVSIGIKEHDVWVDSRPKIKILLLNL